MAQAQVGNQHREQTQNEHQRLVRERQVLGKELGTGAGQANRSHHTGDKDQRGQEEAAQPTEGVLYISMQDHRAVGSVRYQHTAAGTQLEQAQVNQRQTDTGDQARQNGVTRQQFGILHAAGTRSVNNDDAEDQRAQRIHRQIAVNEAGREWNVLIDLGGRNWRTRRPGQRGNTQRAQRNNFQRCQYVADGIEQAARIQRDADHQCEIHQAVNKQRHGTVTGQRCNAHFEGNGRGARGGE
ncbi:hypothetical protein D3C78_1223520 [compost metagenome]